MTCRPTRDNRSTLATVQVYEPLGIRDARDVAAWLRKLATDLESGAWKSGEFGMWARLMASDRKRGGVCVVDGGGELA